MKTRYIDTHCHLNFKRFNKTREQTIIDAQEKGVDALIVPGTDILLSQKAVEIASKYEHIYAAVGIHPHHTMEKIQAPNSNSLRQAQDKQNNNQLEIDMQELEKMIIHPKVVAVGEVGLDRHVYEETKYPNYQISAEFMEAQTQYFCAQIQLAKKYKKALIIHNRETKKEILTLLDKEWVEEMRFRAVFHCCEPDEELLLYAKNHDMFIGMDGDVTYGGEKREFAKKVPLEMLVLETDAPFLLPEPLRAQKLYPNTPSYIPLIAQYIAEVKGILVEEVAEVTTRNAERLFKL